MENETLFNRGINFNDVPLTAISTNHIRYTYEGDETTTLADRTVELHRVREDPFSAPGVSTFWLYDEKGMDGRRYHRRGKQ